VQEHIDSFLKSMRIQDFDPRLASALPETHALLRSANLIVHPNVARIILHGSRGLARTFRPDSDVDLSLIVDAFPPPGEPTVEAFCRTVLETTLNNWSGPVEADLALIFESRPCGLVCFEQATWHERICTIGGVDCFGLYKIQKGFGGFVENAGIEVPRMYPCLRIWRRGHERE
jgi:hypothetical protein